MPVSSRTIWSTAMSELVFSGGGRRRALEVVRRPGTRAMRLSVDPRDASVRLSVPPRAALSPALAWAATKRGWIEAQLAKLPEAQPIVPGMVFKLRGERVRLDWSESHPRRPMLHGEKDGASTSSAQTDLASEFSYRTVRPELVEGPSFLVLRVGGPLEALASRVTRWLKAEALQMLDSETRTLCAAHSLTVTTVGVGDPRGRWGSCSSSGVIRYSWRLILAPPEVLRATVAHEVAHLVHLDHSPAFHAAVAQLYGRVPTAERRWLKTHGTALHWFGRGS